MTRAAPPVAVPADAPSAEASWDVSFAGSRVVFGCGALARLGELVADLGAGKVLLVTDSGIRQAGHVDRAVESLKGASLQVAVFDGVQENPTTRHVDAAVQLARQQEIDLIVALGGGSSLDTAKGANFLLSNGGRMEDYWGTNLAGKPMLPSIGIPTTAGTGSEAQSYALIVQEETRAKMACGDKKARFSGVILDPALTVTQPREITAVTGLDAVGHALESLVTTRRNPASRIFAREAWTHLERNLEVVLKSPGDLDARSGMLWGAHLAGAAIEVSMLGAAHACANPLTSRFGVPHGIAVALTLPEVVRFNRPAVGRQYDELWNREEHGGRTLEERVAELRAAAGLPGRIRDQEVPREALDSLAREAAEQWTGRFNPRPVGEKELLGIYEAAY